jgi:hypothetical protein
VAAFVIVSSTEIVAETAAAPTGKYEVAVSDQYGASHGSPSFTYVTEPALEPAARSMRGSPLVLAQ